ncbi:hypothetical protein GCM10009676_06830 [Prauserella halophila]|uniref:Uncharacterized protein n=1 Tax=Prauserella halophila TaxID=185641 RepID=A0ABN1VYN9_9PSEU
MTVHVTDPQTAQCGFRHCRRPLPPPGPRGGRPYEFCPDRRWPGDKTCKQLAAAEHALRTALGDTDPPTALRDATDTFAEAAGQILEPLQALGGALEDVTARVQDELTAAATRADEADSAAEQARTAQADAEERAAESDRLRDEAVAEADRARADADAAQDTADAAQDTAQQATATAEAAALAQARAEATVEATAERARTAEDQNKVVRARVEELTERLDDLRGQLAQRTGERDTAQAALDEHRARSRDLEQSLTERLTTATTQLDETRAALRETAQREQDLVQRLDDAAAARQQAEQDLAAVRAELADVRGGAERLRTRAAEADRQRVAVDGVLRRVHTAVLDAGDDPATLRELVLRELLSRSASPDDTSPDGAPSDGEPSDGDES